MVTSHSLRLAALSAFAVSTVFAHPLHHVNVHAKRQAAASTPAIVWVTILQTQAAGPGGEPKTFTVLSPKWANAAPTGDNGLTSNATLPAPTSIGADTTIAAPTASSAPADSSIPDASPSDVDSSAAPSSDAAEPTVVAGQFAEEGVDYTPPPAFSSYAIPTPSVVSPPLASSPSAAHSHATRSHATAATSVVSPPAASSLPAAPSYATAATSAVSPPAASSPVAAPSTGGGGGKVDGSKVQYSGVPSEYPPKSSWISFDQLFEASKGTSDSKGMLSYKISEANMELLKNAVKLASDAGNVDPRIPFAMIMQESHGDPTGAGSGGIMQCDGCPTGSWDTVPEAIKGGIEHYNTCVQKFPQNQPWAALRCYNSGEMAVNPNNLNAGNGATDSYVNDIANRLAHGWVI